MSFYKALHNLSMADFCEERTSRKRRVSTTTKEFYEIERVISRRHCMTLYAYYIL